MIGIGVIGCGYWGPNLIRNFAELPEAKIIGCSDLNEERLGHIKSRFPFINTTKKYADLLNDPNIEGVVIATPMHTHFQVAKDALLCGKNILVEKPLTLSSAEAMELIEISKKQKKILMVGHTFEYNVAVEKLKELIKDGSLGKIHYLNSVRVNLGLFQEHANVVWDLAPHDLSILISLLGTEPEKVSAVGNSYIKSGIEDVAFITLWFPGGILANIHVSWLAPHKIRKTTIVGSKKMVVYDDVEQMEKIKIFDKSVYYPSPYETFAEFQFSYKYGDTSIPRLELTEPLKMECKHFLKCIADGTTPRSDGQSGLRVVKCLEAIQRSLSNNGKAEVVK